VTLESRLAALITAIGADIKSLKSQMSDLLSSSYPWSEQIVTTTYTNSTVNASDVTSGFIPVANTRYIVDILASVSSAAVATGVQTAIAGPTKGITSSAVKIVSASAAASDLITHTSLNTFQPAAGGLTSPSLLSIQAIIEVGASPGTANIRFQAKSEVAGSAITIRPGSSMRWRVI
jgi:hypothetical protein